MPAAASLRIGLAAAAVLAAAVCAPAMHIERVVSPGGIEAWLVRAPSSPQISFEFAFRGGANQDPVDKAGVASMVAALLDEGAGDIDSRHFRERLEDKAIEISFRAGRDHLSGSLKTLRENSDEAFDLLRLSLTAPRFDLADVERIRSQMLSGLRRETTSPNDIASRRWWATAFAGHPYGRAVKGTLDTVAAITGDDLRTYARRVLARGALKVGVVGDIAPAELAAVLDRVFGSLPAAPALSDIAPTRPKGLGSRIVVDLDVPQAVVIVGGAGIARKDPDFMAAFIVNHILGGGSFSSRLYREVREERGLAYSVYSTLVPLDYASLFMSTTATRKEQAGQTLDVVEQQIKRLAQEGPTEDELGKAKSYLKGSYALRFDTSGNIASQLVAVQFEDLGIDYIARRNDLVDAVTLADVRRIAKRLLDGGLLVTVVGRPQGVEGKGG
ncbi:MAG: insulinase family protein [Proteobacteria bacterium]|nr:insulinase family protein [Pseudomonadota bacterium]